MNLRVAFAGKVKCDDTRIRSESESEEGAGVSGGGRETK